MPQGPSRGTRRRGPCARALRHFSSPQAPPGSRKDEPAGLKVARGTVAGSAAWAGPSSPSPAGGGRVPQPGVRRRPDPHAPPVPPNAQRGADVGGSGAGFPPRVRRENGEAQGRGSERRSLGLGARGGGSRGRRRAIATRSAPPPSSTPPAPPLPPPPAAAALAAVSLPAADRDPARRGGARTRRGGGPRAGRPDGRGKGGQRAGRGGELSVRRVCGGRVGGREARRGREAEE